ncbi:hypothetical protein NMG60_11009635 [Bertholletia excelsa]
MLCYTQKYSSDFMGNSILVTDGKPYTQFPIRKKPSACACRIDGWWENRLKPNTIEVNLVPELMDYLSNAGNEPLVVHFFILSSHGDSFLHAEVQTIFCYSCILKLRSNHFTC